MGGRNYASGSLSGKAPEWYWRRGLHDAQILTADALELDYDYRQRNPVRNCFRLQLDAAGALFDREVRTISFYNYRILRPAPLEGAFWMGDFLRRDGQRYVLDITVTDLDQEEFTFSIRFESAGVTRA